MSKGAINARIEVIAPLPPDASLEDRMIAAGEAAHLLDLPEAWTAVISTEVVEDDDPGQ